VTLLLYGIVRAGHPLPADLHAVVEDDLAVAVRDIGSAGPVAEDARSHLDVLCGLIGDGPVLPLRFGSTAPDEESVRNNALRADPAALRAELDRVTDRVEVRVQLVFDEAVALAAAAATEPGLAQPVAGLDATIERGRRIHDQIRAWVVRRSAEVLDRLAAEAVRLPEDEEGAQRWALLVRHDALDRIADSIDALPDVVTASVLGPLPPFSFVSLPARPVSRWGFG
jgi:hypothetical protein